MACGLDPEKSIITAQSLIPEHAYLSNLFSSVVTIARMQHLPTYKEKIKQHPEANTMALLNYPVLMAADILLYKAELVPVGVDQEPHLEVAREIARKMNEKYGMDFPEPKRFATKGEYIPSLTGEGKMSKSVEGSFINLTDSSDQIKAKLARVATDSGKGSSLPKDGGVSVLLTLVDLLIGSERKENFEKMYINEGIRYKELKEELAEAIYKELVPIQERRKEIEAKSGYVENVIKEGSERARKIAEETIREVKVKMGFIPEV
jgi:tryptophanyl-tRNA synthetase